jgi:murein DD-endopeptidase MepM/ murein hydrolase activator NlpD
MKVFVLIGVFLGLTGCSLLPEHAADSQKTSILTDSYEFYYQVKRGDTLAKIARKYGVKISHLATWNGLTPPYKLHAGQSLKIISSSRNSSTSTVDSACAPIAWQLPTNGTIVRKISRNGRESLEITGNYNQTIVAAADGTVAYSGSGVKGYVGGLIILYHSMGWHSIYAHNQQRLVSKGATVKRGQPIATLGMNHRRRPVLHFEIRCGRQTVNPLRYLLEK